jgi:hypothetical protein
VSVDSDRISFEVDRLGMIAPGRLEVNGRWLGIRGRRFVRPSITFTLADGSERRALAELKDKPWTAQDGESWTATFATDVELDQVTVTELGVATDIVVVLGAAGSRAESAARGPALVSGPASGRDSSPEEAPSKPRRASPRASSRPSAQRVKRLEASLAASDRALEAERNRRARVERALEGERAESLRLRSELGSTEAQLDLARAAQAGASAAAAELDAARREVLAAERRHDRLTREHDRTIDAHAEDRTTLHERAGALESAREALAQERAETQRLRAQLAARAQSAEHPPRATAPSLAAPRAQPSPTRTDRPLNPSLRHRSSWLVRALALLVILAVIAAVALVIRGAL